MSKKELQKRKKNNTIVTMGRKSLGPGQSGYRYDPGTSHMQSGRSTIWANPPLNRYSTENKFTDLKWICLHCHLKYLKHYMLFKNYSRKKSDE